MHGKKGILEKKVRVLSYFSCNDTSLKSYFYLVMFAFVYLKVNTLFLSSMEYVARCLLIMHWLNTDSRLP